MELDKLRDRRDRIDRIDEEIIDLLARRFQESKDIAEIKRGFHIEIEDERREKDVIRNCKEAAGGRPGLDDEFIERLMGLILSKSKEVQRDVQGGRRSSRRGDRK